MKRIKTIFTFLLIINSALLFSQQTNNNIKYIAFKFYHSKRIPYSEVTIEIFRNENNAIVKVRSKAATNDKEWSYSKIKNEFKIDSKTFEELSEKLIVLKDIDLDKDIGADGTNCIIVFGNGDKSFKYNVWTPGYETDKRNLTYFLERCKELIILGKLDPKEIL